VRWGAFAALLVVVALFAANVGAHVVLGSHVGLFPDPHFGSPLALTPPAPPSPGALGAGALHAG
jgi:hypothetical protein